VAKKEKVPTGDNVKHSVEYKHEGSRPHQWKGSLENFQHHWGASGGSSDPEKGWAIEEKGEDLVEGGGLCFPGKGGDQEESSHCAVS